MNTYKDALGVSYVGSDPHSLARKAIKTPRNPKPLICSLPFFSVRANRHDDGCVLLIVSRGLSQVRGLNDRWVIGVVEADFLPTLKGEAFSCKSELPRLCSYLSGRFGVLSETRKGLPRAPSNLSSDVHGLGRAAHVRCQHPALRY